MLIRFRKIKWSDYLLLFLVVAASGNPAFNNVAGKYLYLFLVILELLFFRKRLTRMDYKKTVLWLMVLVVIFIGQYYTLGMIGFLASGNYIFKVLTGLFAAFILRERFSYLYLRLMTVLTSVSLFFLLLNSIGINLPAIITISEATDGVSVNSLIVYTQSAAAKIGESNFPRNCGMFWEPGAFAGYLLIVFFLYINELPTLWKTHRPSCIILFLGLVSTFSTTGYILFAVLMLVFFIEKKINPLILSVVIAILAIGAWWAFNSIEFLGEKIRTEYEYAMEMDEDEIYFSRMGSLVFDMQYIKMHPVFGNGLIDETRYVNHISYAENLHGFGNGFSGEIAYFGIPFMLFFLFMVYRNPTLERKWLLLFCIVILLQGEYFMNYPLYFVFPVVGFWQLDKKIENDKY